MWRNRTTASGLAGAAWAGRAGLLLLEAHFQGAERQAGGGTVGEKSGDEFAESVGVELVEVELPLASEVDESGIAKLREVVADSGLRLLEGLADGGDVHLPAFGQE